VVIAIVFPALRGARDASKKAGTQAMFSELGSASGQFILDTRRTPGYFSPAEMGATANGDRGFTAMENVMLDLAGGIVRPAPGGGIGSGPPPSQLQRIGPLADPTRQLNVDTSLIGIQGGGTKTYWMPDRKLFVAQNAPNPGGGSYKSVSEPAHRQLPDVVDLFGQPILAWPQDTNVSADTLFARTAFDPGSPANRGMFYWN